MAFYVDMDIDLAFRYPPGHMFELLERTNYTGRKSAVYQAADAKDDQSRRQRPEAAVRYILMQFQLVDAYNDASEFFSG